MRERKERKGKIYMWERKRGKGTFFLSEGDGWDSNFLTKVAEEKKWWGQVRWGELKLLLCPWDLLGERFVLAKILGWFVCCGFGGFVLHMWMWCEWCVITYDSNNTMSNFEILDYHLRWVLYLQSIRVVYVLPFGGFCTAQRDCDVNGIFFFFFLRILNIFNTCVRRWENISKETYSAVLFT